MGEDLNLDHVMLGTPKPHMRVERGLPASNLPHPPKGHKAQVLPIFGGVASDSNQQHPFREAISPKEKPSEEEAVDAKALSETFDFSRGEIVKPVFFMDTSEARKIIQGYISVGYHPGVVRAWLKYNSSRDSRIEPERSLEDVASDMGFDNARVPQTPSKKCDIGNTVSEGPQEGVEF